MILEGRIWVILRKLKIGKGPQRSFIYNTFFSKYNFLCFLSFNYLDLLFVPLPQLPESFGAVIIVGYLSCPISFLPDSVSQGAPLENPYFRYKGRALLYRYDDELLIYYHRESTRNACARCNYPVGLPRHELPIFDLIVFNFPATLLVILIHLFALRRRGHMT